MCARILELPGITRHWVELGIPRETKNSEMSLNHGYEALALILELSDILPKNLMLIWLKRILN